MLTYHNREEYQSKSIKRLVKLQTTVISQTDKGKYIKLIAQMQKCACMHITQSSIRATQIQLQHTHLLLVAYPVSRLQAFLQERDPQLVYGRFVEIVLHKAVDIIAESQKNFVQLVHQKSVDSLFLTAKINLLISCKI